MTDSTSHSMQHSADPSEPDPDFIKWLKENCVPIVGSVFGALVLCMAARYSPVTVDWTKTKDFTEVFAKVTQSLALISTIGYQLEIEVLSDSGYRWRATAIVDKSAFAHNEMGKLTRIGEEK